jgi:5'-3' exonuclease
MGVKGIYPLLISHLSTVSVTALMSQGINKMIIDGSVMMHWAIHKAPWDARPGSDLTTFVQVCLEALRVFENFGFKTLVVFDGMGYDTKNETNSKREAKRKQDMEKYNESVAKGAADPHILANAFNVHGAARRLLQAAMLANSFDWLQALYEADAQVIKEFMRDPDHSVLVTNDGLRVGHHAFPNEQNAEI